MRPEIFRKNISHGFPILVNAATSSNLQSSHIIIETENKNHSDIAVHATLITEKSSIATGDNFLLKIELHNPNHKTIKDLSIYLLQHRKMGVGGGI